MMHTPRVPRAQPGLSQQDVSTEPPVHLLELPYPGYCRRRSRGSGPGFPSLAMWSRGSVLSAGHGCSYSLFIQLSGSCIPELLLQGCHCMVPPESILIALMTLLDLVPGVSSTVQD